MNLFSHQKKRLHSVRKNISSTYALPNQNILCEFNVASALQNFQKAHDHLDTGRHTFRITNNTNFYFTATSIANKYQINIRTIYIRQ